MNSKYLTALAPGSGKEREGEAINVTHVFETHGDLFIEQNANACRDALLDHVRERWANSGEIFPLTGVVWARNDPHGRMPPNATFDHTPIVPVGVDLESEEIFALASAVARQLPSELKDHPAFAGGKDAATEVLAHAKQMGAPAGDSSVEDVQLKLAADAVSAFISVQIIKRAVLDCNAIGVTVFGLTSRFNTETKELEHGLLCFHEHARSGPMAMFCKGTPKGSSLSDLQQWVNIDHREMNGTVLAHFTDMLPPTAYGKPGGEA